MSSVIDYPLVKIESQSVLRDGEKEKIILASDILIMESIRKNCFFIKFDQFAKKKNPHTI